MIYEENDAKKGVENPSKADRYKEKRLIACGRIIKYPAVPMEALRL